MIRWAAIFAVIGGLLGAAGMAQAQANEAKVSFIFNGDRVKIGRDNTQAARFAAVFASKGAPCGAACIAPMQVAEGITTFDETQVLDFLVETVGSDQGLLVDARMPQERARGFIPGSVSLPYSVMGNDNAYTGDILEALGARQFDGVFNFADVRDLLIYDTGPSANEAGDLIVGLLAVGYPADKIKYYRGGMQVWSVLGFSIQEGSS